MAKLRIDKKRRWRPFPEDILKTMPQMDELSLKIYLLGYPEADKETGRWVFKSAKKVANQLGFSERRTRDGFHRLAYKWKLVDLHMSHNSNGSWVRYRRWIFVAQNAQTQTSFFEDEVRTPASYHKMGKKIGKSKKSGRKTPSTRRSSVRTPVRTPASQLNSVSSENVKASRSPILTDLDKPKDACSFPSLPLIPKEQALQRKDCPSTLMPTVRYFFSETGRMAITETEMAKLIALGQLHYPSVIQSKIDAAIKRFEDDGRPRDDVTVGYIWPILCNWSSKWKRKGVKERAKTQLPEFKPRPRPREERLSRV